MQSITALHELRWSVRASFLQYVAGLRDGRASVSEGARLTSDDPQVAVFPADPVATTSTLLAFSGDLRLGGHGGLLFLRLAHPRIDVEAGRGRAELTVADPMSEALDGPRLRLVTLVMTPTECGWAGSDVRLTADGVALFNHVYQDGEPFDDLEIVLARPVAGTTVPEVSR